MESMLLKPNLITFCVYSHLSNSQGGGNKRGGDAKVSKLVNKEEEINEQGGIFWKKWREYITKYITWDNP